MPERKTLDQHIGDALRASADRLVDHLARHGSGHPAERQLTAEQRAEAARAAGDQWLAQDHAVAVVAEMDKPSKGRPDTRSLRYVCHLVTDQGQALLCTVRARDMLTDDGRPVDARATARLLMYQNGMRIPDSPAGIENAPPLEGGSSSDGA